jgi:hypothetical protein
MPKARQLLAACLLLTAGCTSNGGGGGNGGTGFDPVVRAAADARLSLEVLGRWDGGFFSTTAANNPPAYDPETERLFVIHSIRQAVEILDIGDPDDPEWVGAIDIFDLADDLQLDDLGPIRSVAFDSGVLAIALASRQPGGRGIVAFYDARGRELVDPVRVGVGPNALAFTPDGQNIVLVNSGTAEEGEEDGEDGVDPEGSISIIRVGPRDRQDLRSTVTTIGFEEFNGQEDALIAAGVRITGPGATVA